MAPKVEITSIHVLKPSSPAPGHLKTHDLSLLDQLSPSIYPPIIFFYEAKSDSNLPPRLKSSLSRVLSSFYPYAGRINGDVLIDCNDAGIPYSEAIVDCSLSEVLKECDLSLMKQFVPLTEESVNLDHTIPLLVQVSLFKCGGIAIGACSSHKIGDASNFFMFIREWANISLTDNNVLIPEFTISSLFPRIGFLNINTGIDIPLNNKLIRKRFVFSASSISLLKGQTASSSRVQAVSALVWKCAMNAVNKAYLGLNKPEITSSIAMTLVNMRGRLNPPLTETSFGNFVGSFLAEKNLEDNKEIELCDLVAQLRHGFEEFCDGYMKQVQDSKDGVLAILNYSKKIGEMLQRNGTEVFTFSSWCGFPLYKIDFGWGKPRWISVTNTPFKNGIMMMDTKEGNGIEVWANLEEDVMVMFEQDHELLAYCSPSSGGDVR
ncbi:Chloramphenicol acetyltransferase-like domain-containing protein [Artemisia annua]|uniref:Chloramphenicol acetyltransferase-like domain-containing protein n=1 Tax=Artemisia annua TaxID=35608 RepID=A0A2U1MLN3_ARTAN|nr:Chloramphenicol acetyltransferase-like domain-containing protein [Artemisia annua]